MWREFIKTLTSESRFTSGVTEKQIAILESSLNLKLSDELKNLLFETDGVQGEYESGLIWPADRIAADNMKIRVNRLLAENYMPFDSLLFFADAGNGDQFALRVINGKAVPKGVFVWDHENDSRIWVAPSIQLYLEWWLTGKIVL